LRFYGFKTSRRAAVTGLFACSMLLAVAAPAAAQTGGAAAPGGTTPPPPTSGVAGKATLQADGSALAPPDAPRPVRKAINAANKIRTKPYKWGGGHGRWKDKGYDCSGAVSFVLHAAGMLKTPLSSGPLGSKWGVPGVGQWITVYGNAGHAYVVIAGLRFDTSAAGDPTSTKGPRWRTTQRSSAGYSPRHAPGY
jgi:hypothetical protein